MTTESMKAVMGQYDPQKHILVQLTKHYANYKHACIASIQFLEDYLKMLEYNQRTPEELQVVLAPIWTKQFITNILSGPIYFQNNQLFGIEIIDVSEDGIVFTHKTAQEPTGAMQHVTLLSGKLNAENNSEYTYPPSANAIIAENIKENKLSESVVISAAAGCGKSLRAYQIALEDVLVGKTVLLYSFATHISLVRKAMFELNHNSIETFPNKLTIFDTLEDFQKAIKSSDGFDTVIMDSLPEITDEDTLQNLQKSHKIVITKHT